MQIIFSKKIKNFSKKMPGAIPALIFSYEKKSFLIDFLSFITIISNQVNDEILCFNVETIDNFCFASVIIVASITFLTINHIEKSEINDFQTDVKSNIKELFEVLRPKPQWFLCFSSMKKSNLCTTL